MKSGNYRAHRGSNDDKTTINHPWHQYFYHNKINNRYIHKEESSQKAFPLKKIIMMVSHAYTCIYVQKTGKRWVSSRLTRLVDSAKDGNANNKIQTNQWLYKDVPYSIYP